MKTKKKRNSRYKYRGKLKILLVILISIAAVFIFSHADRPAPDFNGTRVVAYLPSWNHECYDEIDMKALTHLNIAFANPDGEGNLSIAIPDRTIKRIVKKAHRNDVRVLVSLGGGNGFQNYLHLIENRASRKALNKEILHFITSHDLDGIDLNIEGDIEPRFWNYYHAWVLELQKLCEKEDLTLSCAAASWFDSYISGDTFDCFDFISIMAYDNKGDYNHASYDYSLQQMEYFSHVRNIDEDRLILGVPFYGYRYQGNSCTGEAVTFGEIAKYNEDSQFADESGTCRYNGIDTIKKKAALSKKYGGIMIWSIDQDADGRYSLLKAISETISQ